MHNESNNVEMRTGLVKRLVLAVACVVALSAAADDVVLQPPLTLAKGQAVVTVQQSQAATKVLDAKTKQAVKDLSQSRVLELHQAVLETDEASVPTAVRLTVTARLDLKATLPREDAFEQRVELKNVQVDLRFADGAWRVDTESIRSKDMKSLTSAEMYVLRRAVRDAAQVHARPDLSLLPARAAATAKLQPTLEQLSRWSASANESGRIRGEATDASFRITSRTASAVDVAGRVELLVPVEERSVKAAMELSLQIDSATGLVRRRRVEFSMAATAGAGVIQSTGSGLEVTSVREKADLPTGPLNALGWKAVSDASTWRDAPLGVGLTLPRAAVQRPGQTTWDIPGGGSVSVEIRPRDFLPTLAQVLEPGVENLRRDDLGLKDIEPGEPFRLPDGLPAAIVHARSQDGKTALLVLLTADGFRTLAVTAACPADNKTLLAQLEQTLRSLRVQGFNTWTAAGK
ncbi:MAG: hypothetical protein FWE88_05510 [Phycisphaerae bacterium]|nr:hypothetical protein [Phycisphaerae bacterium]